MPCKPSFLDARALGLAAASALLFSGFTIILGCGEEPVALRFQDASEGCNPTPGRLEQPIARGARLDVSVSTDQGSQHARSVSVDDDRVLDARVDGDVIAVQALAVGQTRLSVTTECGADGHLDLSVAEPAAATVVPDDLTVWSFDTALTVQHPGATAGLTATGFALLPDGRLTLGVSLTDAQGRALIGYGVAGWTATPNVVDLTAADPRRDDVTVAPRDQIGTVTLTTIAGGHIDLTLLPDEAAASLEVYSPETGSLGGPLALAAGEARTVVLVAHDADGHLLLGNGPAGFSAALVGSEASSIAALIDPPWATGDLALDDAGRATLAAERVVTVKGLSAGQATLHLAAAGQSLDVPITVSP